MSCRDSGHRVGYSCAIHDENINFSGLIAYADPGVLGGGGGGRGPDPSGKLQSYKFLSNTGPDPLENHKATKPAFK